MFWCQINLRNTGGYTNYKIRTIFGETSEKFIKNSERWVCGWIDGWMNVCVGGGSRWCDDNYYYSIDDDCDYGDVNDNYSGDCDDHINDTYRALWLFLIKF